MLKMPDESEDPPSRTNTETQTVDNPDYNGLNSQDDAGLVAWVKGLVKGKPESSLREAIEEYIVEPENFEEVPTISAQERAILANILKLRDITAINVMIPRADIVAVDVNIPNEELYNLLAEKRFSRIPVYQDTLDEVLGTIHIKDIFAALATGQQLTIRDLLTDIPIVSPSISLLDLVLKMRHSRRHMVLVVDEYGGIDGLVTIGDIIESIIGEIDDEHDTDAEPEMVLEENGTVLADGRVDIEEFEERFGMLLSEEEREESDTLGGLVSAIAGRVPVRGEVLTHDTGMIFEVLDADPRRVNKLRIKDIPAN